ncbi:MAG: pyrroline-5-carboxylate reductase [Kangiellaceae bacterium]|nr:pyrroline-5-carboxylate reductase [Kangiellaceae bacterium]
MASKNCHSISALEQKAIGFIGAGNMAQAIIHGLAQAGIAPASIHCSNPSQPKLDRLRQQYSTLNVYQHNATVAERSDILLLAVKPQMMSKALASISGFDFSQKLLVSVAAGVETDAIEQQLQQTVAIVRAMPNTPATIGLGATGLYANGQVSQLQKQQAETVFNAVGNSVWILDEQQMDLVTAVSGSGPAHYFLFLEAVIQSAVEQGMDAETAKQLAVQTALGAAQMVSQNSATDIAELRANVTSPGGTTAAAIESFQTHDFAEIIDTALKASVRRGKELAQIAKEANKQTDKQINNEK